MGILGGKLAEDDEQPGGDGLSLDLDLSDKVCPVCGLELAPWADRCPADGAIPVDAAAADASGPTVPAHLLDGIEASQGAGDGEPHSDPDQDVP